MQLGTRWPFGAEPPRAVPPELREAIARHEREAGTGGAWTLTWLEGRAIAQADDGTLVRAPGDSHETGPEGADEEW